MRAGSSLAFTIFLGLVAMGCTVVHEVEVEIDRFHYVNALGDSRESQALMNLVRIRYGEFPSFVDLSQVVTNYDATDQLVTGARWKPQAPGIEENYGESNLVATTTLAESPSMVYLPVEGPELVRKLFIPAQISVVLALSRSGWEIGPLLATMVESVNDAHNRELLGTTLREADPEFLRFVRTMSRLDGERALTFHFDPPSKRESEARLRAVAQAVAAPSSAARAAALADLGPEPVKVRLCFREDALSQEARSELAALRSDLGLAADRDCYRVRSADEERGEGSLNVQMRSLYKVLETFAADVEIPEAVVASGAALPLIQIGEANLIDDSARIRIRSGGRPPSSAQVAVKYAREWYWLDPGDPVSKATFNYLVLLLSLTEAGGTGAQLVVTTN